MYIGGKHGLIFLLFFSILLKFLQIIINKELLRYLNTREIDDIIKGRRLVGVNVFNEVPDEQESNSTKQGSTNNIDKENEI